MSLLRPRDPRVDRLSLDMQAAGVPVEVIHVFADQNLTDHVSVVAVPLHSGLIQAHLTRGGEVILSAFGLTTLIESARYDDGTVGWQASNTPPATLDAPVAVLAPWRAPDLGVLDEVGQNMAPLGVLLDEYPSVVAALTDSNTGWPHLVQSLAQVHEEVYGQVVRHVYVVPAVRAVQSTRRGLVLTADVGHVGVPAWAKLLPSLRAALRLPDMRLTPDLTNGVVRLEGRDRSLSFPSAVALPLTALAAYPNTRVPLGVDEVGDVVEWEPRTQPHVLGVGSTGGGKSVSLRGLISAVLAAPTSGNSAWSVYLAEGKGSDYTALRSVPGVAAVTAEMPAHVWLIATVRKELDRRRAQAARNKAAGNSDPYSQFQPWLLLLDEWADVSGQIAAKYGKKGLELVQSDIASILRVGREARIHCIVATQELRVEAVPGSWQDRI